MPKEKRLLNNVKVIEENSPRRSLKRSITANLSVIYRLKDENNTFGFRAMVFTLSL